MPSYPHKGVLAFELPEASISPEEMCTVPEWPCLSSRQASCGALLRLSGGWIAFALNIPQLGSPSAICKISCHTMLEISYLDLGTSMNIRKSCADDAEQRDLGVDDVGT